MNNKNLGTEIKLIQTSDHGLQEREKPELCSSLHLRDTDREFR